MKITSFSRFEHAFRLEFRLDDLALDRSTHLVTDLDFDSLAFFGLSVWLDDDYSVTLPEHIPSQLLTLGGIYDYYTVSVAAPRAGNAHWIYRGDARNLSDGGRSSQ